MFQSRQTKTISRLRSALTTSRSAESLRDLPERLATIIQHFDALTVHPDFRQDIFNVLDAATSMAESLMDETYPADHAVAQITGVMQVLPRLIDHLMKRPMMQGFSILNPSNGSIYPQVHSTEVEANASLEHLQKMGAARGCIVVPVKVNSMHAIQPLDRRLPPPVVPAFDPDRIPPGIKPEVPVGDWEPENTTRDEDFWGPRKQDIIQKEADRVAAGLRGTGTWEGPSERAKAAAAGPEQSIPIDAHAETVSLPNLPPQSRPAGGQGDPPPPAAPAGNGISQPNIDPAADPGPVPAPSSQTDKA